MCYPCTQCGRCGKYDPKSPYYTPPATIPCLACGGEVDPATGACRACGQVAFAPGTGRAGGEAPRHARGGAGAR